MTLRLDACERVQRHRWSRGAHEKGGGLRTRFGPIKLQRCRRGTNLLGIMSRSQCSDDVSAVCVIDGFGATWSEDFKMLVVILID